MPWVELEEIDRALAHRKVKIGRANIRPGRCGVKGCALFIPSGKGNHLYIDGVDRCLICVNHHWAICETARTGKEEL